VRGIVAAPASVLAMHAGTRCLGSVAGVDLWGVDLDAPGDEGLLSASETERAGRFAFPRDRRRFAAGRAAVRTILAAYVGAAPAALRIVEGEHGKPTLPGGPRFSFSRSHGLGLCAVASDRDVGVDLERLREIPEAAEIAAALFTPAERASWRDGGGGGGAAFLRVWVRKEALLKAFGLGLPADGAGGLPPGASSVEIIDLELVPGCAAALAVVPSRPSAAEPGPRRIEHG
jgi:4'-phosphopantetheinyl transferase